MPRSEGEPFAWVIEGIRALNEAGSWTGRVHTHKLFYLMSEFCEPKPPFSFQLYDYGPYSFELDRVFSEAESNGLIIRTYPKTGYGPKYLPSSVGAGHAVGSEVKEAIGKVASLLGNKSSKDLELIATCHWVERHEKLTDELAIVRRVIELKPRYSEDQPKVVAALREERLLADRLSQV